jgi:two-component system NtrC family sensor kinase
VVVNDELPPARNGWVFANVAAFIAMGARVSMQPLLGDQLPFIFAFPAIVLVASRHGAPQALLSSLLCAAWVALPFLPPRMPLANMPLELGSFALSAVLTALICAQYRHSAERTSLSAGLSETALTRWLRAVVWGAALIPLTAFAAACWWGHQKAFEDDNVTVSRANGVVSQHATRALEMAQEVAARVQEFVALPDADLRTRQAEIHERLQDIATGLPAVYTITVIDRTGHSLASSRVYPVNEQIDLSDRDYFKHYQTPERGGLYVSELVTGRLSGQVAFNAVVPRRTAGNEFDGIIAVTLKPSHFQEFYGSLATEEPGLSSFSFFKADGALLTRWPAPSDDTTRVPERSPLLPPARAGQKSGVLYIQSSFDTEHRLISFQRLGDLPVYTTAALSEGAILAGWYRFVELLAAIILPTTAGLVYVSWLALQRTRRAQSVLHELQGEMQRRTQAELALIQSQKLEALGQLTGGVAHDFNNLLAIVSNNVHLLKLLHPEVGGGAQVAAIGRATASGVKLTRQLLSFARKHALKPEVISLQEWLPGVADLIRTTLGSRIQFTTFVDAETAPIEVDPAELELALINLVVNAKDAMPHGGSIRITASNVDDGGAGKVALRVADTGTGITPELLGKVFEPFFTTKAPGKGSGLGLSQVYGLCVQAGGTATAESELGKGTTISLLFEARTPTVKAQESQLHAPTTAMSGCVLLVEDNDELAAAQESLLKSVGLRVDRARSADVAAAMAEMVDSPFDVVLSDIVMPGSMNGVQLAFRLRETKLDLPVILTTGYAGMVDEATAAGFVVLSKPTPPEELFAELARALGLSKASPATSLVRTPP